MTTTAKIAAKGTSGTGITEDLAEKLHNQLGKKVLAVVELVAEARSEKRNGDESVSLSILTIEPAPNTDTEDHLRNLARAFHYERGIADGQLSIDTQSDLEPDVADVLAAGRAREPHEYIPAGGPDDPEECDLCGAVRNVSLHHSADELDLNTDDDGEDDEDQDDQDQLEAEQDLVTTDELDTTGWEANTYIDDSPEEEPAGDVNIPTQRFANPFTP